MTKFLKKYLFWFFVIGLILRIGGIFFVGTHDMVEAFLPWGTAVLQKGLANGFQGIYFPTTYIFFGFCAWIAKSISAFWFLPFKATNLLFEFLLLVFLLKIFNQKRKQIVLFYWLNPWLILMGSWQGFWDALMVLFLFTSSFMFESKLKNKYLLSGFLIGMSLMIKPQAQVVILSAGVFLFFREVIKFKLKRTIEYFLGSILPFLGFSLYFFISGKPITSLLKYLLDTKNVFPVFVASEINIWHPLSRLFQIYFNQPGRIYNVNLGEFWFNLITNLSVICLLSIVTFFVLKTRAKMSDIYVISLWLLPQIVTMSHVNHFIAASVLMIPYVIKYSKLKLLWLVSITIHFYNAFARYGLGFNVFFDMEKFDMGILQSMLGVIQFVVTVLVIKTFFEIRKDDTYSD